MPTIVVGTNSFETQTEADTYLDGAIHASSWGFAAPLTKQRSLITAFRDINTFELRDPDTGLVIDPSAAPQDLKDAQSELAFWYSEKPARAQDATQGGSNIESVGAGSAKVSFFTPQDGGRYPPRVMRLLSQYLNGGTGGGVSGSCASGTDGVSVFKDAIGELSEGYK